MTNRICVDCGSNRVHRSRRRSWLDRAVLILGGRPCRCHACNARFARFGGALVHIATVHRAARGMAVACVMITAAAVVLAGIIWLSHYQRPSGPEETQGVLWETPAAVPRGIREA